MPDRRKSFIAALPDAAGNFCNGCDVEPACQQCSRRIATMFTLIARPLGLLVVLFSLAGALAACDDTIRGMGQDVEDTGDAVGDAVQ
jgi:predicted small secreted protein